MRYYFYYDRQLFYVNCIYKFKFAAKEIDHWQDGVRLTSSSVASYTDEWRRSLLPRPNLTPLISTLRR